MSFIQRELERIEKEIHEILQVPRLNLDINNLVKKEELYAAQQALKWALDPNCFPPPYNMIMDINEAISPPKDKPQIQPSIVGNSPSYRAG